MELHEYESRLNRPIKMKLPEFQRNERLKHVISSEQFDIGLLEHLSNVATMIKNITGAKEGHDYLSSLLSHKRAMLYFTQASTRTFLSFMAACQILGLKCNEIRDPSVSSEYKGESAFDSVRMFSSYFDIIIMRSGLHGLRCPPHVHEYHRDFMLNRQLRHGIAGQCGNIVNDGCPGFNGGLDDIAVFGINTDGNIDLP